ncbi:unnamed protein product, partial [Didymodactylos carnosus]
MVVAIRLVPVDRPFQQRGQAQTHIVL